ALARRRLIALVTSWCHPARSTAGAAAFADAFPALRRRRLALSARPFLRGGRSCLLGPGLAVSQHRHVRVPAIHRAERESRARAIAGRHVADPVRGAERDLLLAGAAPLPECRFHRAPPRTTSRRSAHRTADIRAASGRSRRPSSGSSAGLAVRTRALRRGPE